MKYNKRDSKGRFSKINTNSSNPFSPSNCAENEVISDGVKYISKIAIDCPGSCTGCELNQNGCFNVAVKCCAKDYTDNKYRIWVKKEVTAKKKEVKKETMVLEKEWVCDKIKYISKVVNNGSCGGCIFDNNHVKCQKLVTSFNGLGCTPEGYSDNKYRIWVKKEEITKYTAIYDESHLSGSNWYSETKFKRIELKNNETIIDAMAREGVRDSTQYLFEGWSKLEGEKP